MSCKGCGESKTLIKAHIIPRAFYMDLRDDENHLNVLSSEDDVRTRRSFIGDYDRNILCANCDKFLGRFDEYGKKTFLDEVFALIPISKAGMIAGWEIKGCDPVRLQKFILAILWRASISSRSFFRRVKLGPYDSILRDYLWGEDRRHSAFGVILARFRPSSIVPSVEKTILDPDRFRFDGSNYYRVYLGGFVVWVRVDRRGPEVTMSKMELAYDKPCIAISRDFDSSIEMKVIRKGV